MKKKGIMLLVLVLVLSIAFSGCKKNEEPAEEPITPPVQQPVEEAPEDEKKVIMDEFANLIDSNPHSLDIKAFIYENLHKLGQLEVSTMIDYLETSLKDNLEDLREQISAADEDGELVKLIGSDLFLKEELIEDIKDKDLKDLIYKSYQGHYKLISIEGKAEPIIDYGSLLQYESKLTEEWKEYILLMAIDSDSPPYLDGSLVISFDQLGERIAKLESYMNRYISGPRQEELLEIYESRLTAFMMGLPNTPIAAYDNNIIFENVYKAYEGYAVNEGLVSAEFIQMYMTDIRENYMKVDNRILGLADEYIKEAVRTMREFK